MKETELKEKFIELRAENYSYDKIVEMLGGQVSKRTLINWEREFSIEIKNLRAERLDTLREKYLMSQSKKIELWGELLQKIKSELLERDLSKVEADKLLTMLIKTEEKLNSVSQIPIVLSDEEIKREKEWNKQKEEHLSQLFSAIGLIQRDPKLH